MSQPPRDPYRQNPYGSDPYRDDPHYGQSDRQPEAREYPYSPPGPYSQQEYRQTDAREQSPYPPSHQDRVQRQREYSQDHGVVQAGGPLQSDRPRGRGRQVLGVGLVLAILGALVLLVSATVLPWVDGELSLSGLWQRVTDVQDMGFGDWYVAIGSYPLVALGILLSFAAVLESVAMKVIWVALTVLGLGYVALRYGLGPATGLFGDASGISPVGIAVAAVSLVALVVVLFVLKSAVGMFRRIAGLVLLGLSGVHIGAIADLVGANGFTELSAGAYGPALGYLLAGAAAFVGPRRLVPGA